MDAITKIKLVSKFMDLMVAGGDVTRSQALYAAGNLFRESDGATLTFDHDGPGSFDELQAMVDKAIQDAPVAAKKNECGHAARRLAVDPKELVRYFPSGPENADGLAEIVRAASEGCGITKAEFATIRQELMERKWIAQDPASRWFRTSLAEEFIAE